MKNRSAFCLVLSLCLFILAGCFQPVKMGETYVEKGTAYLRVSNDSADSAYVLEGIELRNAEGAAEQSWDGLGLTAGNTWEVHTETAGAFTLVYRVKDMWISTSEIKAYDAGPVEIVLNKSNELSFDAEKLSVTLQDSDGDGFPDSWELENGLNPEDKSDGGTVYVKADGKDTNNGTQSSPYRTLAKAVAKAGRGLNPAASTVAVVGTLTWANGGNDRLNKEYPGKDDSVFYLEKTRSPVTIRGESNGTLTADGSGGKRVLYIGPGSRITLRDITITGGKGTGGGIYAFGAVLVTLGSGAKVKDNNVNNGVSGIEGGGIYMARGAMVMEGDSIVSGNEAYMCGGIKLFASTLTMKGTSAINNNKAAYAIAGIRIENSTVTMLDESKISGNTLGAADNTLRDVGGGVTIIYGGLTMSGKSKITGNTTYNGWAGGVQVSGEGVLTMEGESEISGNRCIISANTLTTPTKNFSRARGAGVFVDYGGSLRMKSGTITGNTAYGSGGGVHVSTGASFDMEGGSITENTGNYGGGVAMQNGSSFKMAGGDISENTASISGGGVLSSNNAIFEMTGGKITNNIVSGTDNENKPVGTGGGVYLGNDSLFTMKNGEISSNAAAIYGGGIYLSDGASFEMTGGLITGNTAKSGGGVIVLRSSSFTMAGGEISSNTADDFGGGVYLAMANSSAPGASFEMTGGEIASNTAKYAAGVFVNTGAAFTMTGGHVYGEDGEDKKNNATEGDKKNPNKFGHAVYSRPTENMVTTEDNTITSFPPPADPD